MTARRIRISLSLATDVVERVDRLAAEAKLSRSAFIKAVLRQYLRMKPGSIREE